MSSGAHSTSFLRIRTLSRSADHELGFDQHLLGPLRPLGGYRFDQQVGGAPAHLGGSLIHRSERHREKIRVVDIAGPDYSDIVRNLEPGLGNGPDPLDRNRIVVAEN